MGKRTRDSADSEYEHISKKIKKLNHRLMRARRKRTPATAASTSSSEESASTSSESSPGHGRREKSRSATRQPPPASQDPSNIEDVPHLPSESAGPLPSTSASNNMPVPTLAALTKAQATACATICSAAEPNDGQVLNEDLLKILGDDPSQQKLLGNNIHADLSIRLQHVATLGLDKESRKQLMEQYLPPANCILLDAPTLNPEVKATIPETVLKRDKAIETKQKQLCAVASCIAQTLSGLITQGNDTVRIQHLMNASRLLCDIQHTDSVTRRNFVIHNIKKDMKDQLSATKIDKFIFSEDLTTALKTAKAISKTSADMKPTPVANKIPARKPQNSRNLNWKAPPRQTRQKGNQRRKQPAHHKNFIDNSSRKSSHPAQQRR